MNRAGRRRQTKALEEPPAPEKKAPAPRLDIAQIKTQLQQATSPEQVQQIVSRLLELGLPPAGGEELIAYAAQYHEALAILSSNNDAAAVELLVNTAHEWADSRIDQSPDGNRRACKSGCAFCCYLPVVLASAAEVVYLADWLRTHCSSDELQQVRERLEARCVQDTASSQSKKPFPCALLQDNQCMVYEARPFKCRGWNSVRLKACEQAYGQSETTTKVPVDTFAFVMGNAVLNGLSDSTHQAGLDGGAYELNSALLRALEFPDATLRWRRGEGLFDTSR
jgi:hypothetical protein